MTRARRPEHEEADDADEGDPARRDAIRLLLDLVAIAAAHCVLV